MTVSSPSTVNEYMNEWSSPSKRKNNEWSTPSREQINEWSTPSNERINEWSTRSNEQIKECSEIKERTNEWMVLNQGLTNWINNLPQVQVLKKRMNDQPQEMNKWMNDLP